MRPNKQQTTSEIINMRTYAFVGTIGLSTPLDIANRAITATDKLGGNSTSRYYLRADAKGRIYAHRITRKRTNETGLFCGYARGSDPDWLAEEIEGVANA